MTQLPLTFLRLSPFRRWSALLHVSNSSHMTGYALIYLKKNIYTCYLYFSNPYRDTSMEMYHRFTVNQIHLQNDANFVFQLFLS